ncbi:MAG: hypothetical protein ACT6FE_08175 [Methanosarcinaceae archaeon]
MLVEGFIGLSFVIYAPVFGLWRVDFFIPRFTSLSDQDNWEENNCNNIIYTGMRITLLKSKVAGRNTTTMVFL